ncbi:MAG: response regulator transcription factor [Pseudomonadota bacterium]
MDARTKIIVADDHPLFREALIHAIKGCVGAADVVEAATLESLQDAVEDHVDADLLLLDLHMPGVTGFSALAYIRNRREMLPTVIVSANDEPATIRRAIQHGASGFIPKSSGMETIEAALGAVIAGSVWVPDGVALEATRLDQKEQSNADALADLTPHQFRVLLMIAEGLMNKQIAYQLGVSEATIKAHVTAILKKLGVNNRTQAVLAVKSLDVEQKAFNGTADG